MRRTSLALFLLAFLVAVPAAYAAGGHYATKADEKAGVLTPGEVPLAGGDTCGTETPIPPLGIGGTFFDTGDTTGKSNTVGTLPAGCSDYTSVAGPDHIYTFTTGASNPNNPSFLVQTSDDDYDPSIYILGTCGSAATCVTGSDGCFARTNPFNPCGPVSDEQIGPQAFAMNTQFFFYIDSFYAIGNGQESGPYNLTVTGPLPVELIDFSVE